MPERAKNTERKPEDDQGPLELEVVLPQQFYTRQRGRAEGEQRLLIAVLDEAIGCYRKNAFAADRRGHRLFSEASDWMHSDEKQPFSFNHICEVLGLDPAYLRDGLRNWREEKARQRVRAVATEQWRGVSAA